MYIKCIVYIEYSIQMELYQVMCSWTWFWSSGEIIMSDINKDFVCQLQPILSRHDSTAYPYILHSEELKTCRSCLSWLLILFGPRSCKKVNCRWWNVNKKNDKNFPPNTYINNICFQWQFTCKWSGHKYFVMIERTRPPARA